MYFPYFRGKQYELITIRETAGILSDAGFVPIIAPVREQFRGLHKTLEAICEKGGQAVLIINPEHGELSHDGSSIGAMLDSEFDGHENLLVGVRLDNSVTSAGARELCAQANGRPLALIHAGFKDANDFAENLGDFPNIATHIFLEDDCGKLYQKKFKADGVKRVLIRDGFERRRNRDHPDAEFFSDLHITYEDEGMDGFGDFLIVGDDFSESGGPAYTIAIHLTYIDDEQDGAMFVRHFLSDRQDTPKDPGGKFVEALTKLVAFLDGPSGWKVYDTSAVREFRGLLERAHYPGLGYVKKLSMKHHIETLAQYFGQNPPEDR
jgi:hypothetical protein